ncbi:spondin domain-containing protein, partial [Salmonella sp. s51228]|uniref:spondin domain-containing protein n=1 Tax=Salmonella sp. s51228 TaxID=3159652 RepID=UPI00398079E0
FCIFTVCIGTKEFNDSSCAIKCKNSYNVVTFIKDQSCLPLFGSPIDTVVEYTVKFVGTWNDETHTFHRKPNHWSPMSGISHMAAYEVFENCFKNVTLGVEDVSERGSAAQIEREYIVNEKYILDSFRGNGIVGDGTTQRTLRVNKWFHYITVISMMGNTPDYMLGVDRLDLISDNRKNWKKSVKICATLYASGTKTKPVRCPNSIQYENCSFAYFQFTLKEPSLVCQQNEVLKMKPFL